MVKRSQAPMVTLLFGNGFSAITSVTFRRRSKRIAFLESVNFYTYVCMKIFDFCDGHVTTFRHPSGACILLAKCLVTDFPD